ncbi:MAG: ABC transporter permease [Lentilactobacillus diolivorans]
MKQLFKKRLANHLTEMMKYLRLVFNDYFVLALVFLIGGLGYYYSNALKQLHSGIWWAPLLTIGVLLIGIQLGRFATLVQDPDYVFLLPQESEMVYYLRSAYRYSLVLACVTQVIIWIVLMPFVQVTLLATTSDLFYLLASILLLKAIWLNADFARKYRVKSRWVANRFLFRFLLPLAIFTISFYFEYWVGTLLTFLIILFSTVNSRRWGIRSLDWRTMIDDENNRMHTVYQFFNLFTDVPSLNGSVRRRRYLDWMLRRIRLIPENTYLYLYAHGILRDHEMGGLYFRLTVIGTLFLVFIKGEMLPIALCLIFLYLIGFQMIPFYFHFDDNAFVHIYPVTNDHQMKNFQRVLLIMLCAVATIFAIAVIAINYTNVVTIIGVIVGELLEVLAFIYLYVPRRIQRGQRSRNI